MTLCRDLAVHTPHWEAAEAQDRPPPDLSRLSTVTRAPSECGQSSETREEPQAWLCASKAPPIPQEG